MIIILPCAGEGRRFKEVGFLFPKFLIPILGKPMIELVLDSVGLNDVHYIFLCRTEHIQKYELPKLFRELTRKLDCSFEIIPVDKLTEGAACSVLLAKHRINNNQKLAIINSDQVWKYSAKDFLMFLQSKRASGGILTYPMTGTKWSYVKTDSNDMVLEVAEKVEISNRGTIGAYFFEHGASFVEAAERMINKNKRVNGEFYVCPVFTELIEAGQRIYCYDVDEFDGLGIPEDLRAFEAKYVPVL